VNVTGRGTQVVRERSAKPLSVGSIPTRASSISLQLLARAAVRSDSRFRAGWASIDQIWPQGRTKSGQDFDPSIWPPFLLTRCLLGGSQNLVIVEHRAALILSCWMHVALHQTNRAVTKDGRQRGQVDARLREASCESVAEVVKDEREFNSGFQPRRTNSVMGAV
jgi:hypothetical protein